MCFETDGYENWRKFMKNTDHINILFSVNG